MNKMRKFFYVSATLAFMSSNAGATFAGSFTPAPSYVAQPRNAYIESMIKAGEAAEKAKNLALAERYYRYAAVRCAALKKNNEEQLADILSLCSKLYEKKKKYDVAISYAVKLLELEEKMYGKSHVYIAESAKKLADLQAEAGQLTEARDSYLRAADIASNAFAGGYYWCVTAANANSVRKLDLVIACYDGYVKTFEKVDDGGIAIDDAYRMAIDKLATVREVHAPYYNPQMVMLDHYRDYLARANRPEAKSDVDKEIDEMTRKESLNQNYSKGSLPKG